MDAHPTLMQGSSEYFFILESAIFCMCRFEFFHIYYKFLLNMERNCIFSKIHKTQWIFFSVRYSYIRDKAFSVRYRRYNAFSCKVQYIIDYAFSFCTRQKRLSIFSRKTKSQSPDCHQKQQSRHTNSMDVKTILTQRGIDTLGLLPIYEMWSGINSCYA